MATIVPQNHYVYTLTNSLTGNVFYVGKGHSIKRMNAHEREAAKGIDSYKCRVIRKIWSNDGYVIRQVVAEFTEALDALIYEWFLINLVYGIENLTNISEGGMGPNGFKRTPEQNEANRVRAKRRMQDSRYRMIVAEANRGRKKTEHEIESQRQAMIQIYRSPEKREFHRQDRLEWWQSEEGLKLREQYRLQSQAPESHIKKLGLLHIGNTYNAKTYTGFISPEGKVFKDVLNLKKFCQEHGLTFDKMCSVNSGKCTHHKGWRKYNPDEMLTPFVFPSYTYSFVSPFGITYINISNLAQFSREHGLDKANMYRVAIKQQRQYKGWTQYDPLVQPKQLELFRDC